MKLSEALGLLLAVAAPALLQGQISTGTVRGVVVDIQGRRVSGAPLTVIGSPAAFEAHARSNAGADFNLVLPYGQYRFGVGAETSVTVEPLRTVCVQVEVDNAAAVSRVAAIPCRTLDATDASPWAVQPREQNDAAPYTADGLLLLREPSTVSEPLNFSGLAATPLELLSQKAFSWTDTRHTLQGANTTDPYQPGRELSLVDTASTSDMMVRGGLDLGASPAFGTEVATFLSVPPAAWHTEAATAETGSGLASGNLPAPAQRGALQQSERFRWFTHDSVQTGGPLGGHADLFLSAAGQWAARTVPQAATGLDQQSRILFGEAVGRVQLTDRDQLDGQFHASRVALSDWGTPTGLEALVGRRMSPTFGYAGGFAGLPESDGLNLFQVGWNRQMVSAGRAEDLEVRYSFSSARLDTWPNVAAGEQSKIELVTGVVSGAPPLANKADRSRQSLQTAYEPGRIEIAKARHTLVLGAGWERSSLRNRFAEPQDMNLVTVNGVPAFVIGFYQPVSPARQIIQDWTAYATDQVQLAPWFSVTAGALADFARGGTIAWDSVSPRAGFALAVPGFERLVLRGSYARTYAPLAGRYLDFEDSTSLGGVEYQWLDKNNDGIFQPGEYGLPLMKFGGLFSAIDPALKRPYADEFNVGAEISLPRRSVARIELFRRDEKNRIAAEDTGVPPQAYRPVTIVDPGPDGITGTFDDQNLTVYAQDPATFAQDRYLLTNPPGLRVFDAGVVTEAGASWKQYQVHASLAAEKSYGPTNPGNSPLENDPGVVGSLYLDPNLAINAAGRTYFDRAYVGKLQFLGQFPKALGSIEWSNMVNYLDGLDFARRLLVTGLPQGPLLVDTTVRGSPGGGNRAEHVLNWNLRVSRSFRVSAGRLRLALDVFNVTNAAHRIQESEVTGSLFNQRLPVAIEPARFVRFQIEYQW